MKNRSDNIEHMEDQNNKEQENAKLTMTQNRMKSTQNSSEISDDMHINTYNKKSNNNNDNNVEKDSLDEIDDNHILKIIFNSINKAIEEVEEKEEEE